MRNIFRIFLPRKVNFYQMLIEQARETEKGIKALNEFMKTGESAYADTVAETEVSADLKRRVLLDELEKTFVTPFEREDIYTLSKAIDDIMDYGHSTVEEMEVFRLQPTPELAAMVSIILELASAITLAVEHLELHRSIANEYAVQVKSLENKVENLYRRSLATLFESDNMKLVFKTREIYRHLSNCADKGDLAADAIIHIIVKMN